MARSGAMVHDGSPPEGEHFRDAIARWQLGLQSELKRASSLPSSTFDACDPMLEARLAAATESLFRDLLELEQAAPGAPAAAPPRLEVVLRDELAALLRDAAGGRFAADAPPSLHMGSDAEFQAILAETCCRADGPHRPRAAALLGAANADHLDDLDALTAAIAGALTAALGPAEAAALEATCRRVALSVWRHARRAGRQGGA